MIEIFLDERAHTFSDQNDTRKRKQTAQTFVQEKNTTTQVERIMVAPDSKLQGETMRNASVELLARRKSRRSLSDSGIFEDEPEEQGGLLHQLIGKLEMEISNRRSAVPITSH